MDPDSSLPTAFGHFEGVPRMVRVSLLLQCLDVQ